MMCNGLVMIYMGPDGTDVDHMWGTLDGTDANEVGDALCQQLGYHDGRIDLEPFRDDPDCHFNGTKIKE